jgi:hypothetical protein
MSTTSIMKQVAPLACPRCGDDVGPFVPGAGLCEDCEPEVASALRGESAPQPTPLGGAA